MVKGSPQHRFVLSCFFTFHANLTEKIKSYFILSVLVYIYTSSDILYDFYPSAINRMYGVVVINDYKIRIFPLIERAAALI